VAARFNAWVFSCWLSRIVGLNPAGGVDVSLVTGVCCQVDVSASVYPLSKGGLPSVVCLSVIMKRRLWPTREC
jgi:hypothetical protein